MRVSEQQVGRSILQIGTPLQAPIDLEGLVDPLSDQRGDIDAVGLDIEIRGPVAARLHPGRATQRQVTVKYRCGGIEADLLRVVTVCLQTDLVEADARIDQVDVTPFDTGAPAEAGLLQTAKHAQISLYHAA